MWDVIWLPSIMSSNTWMFSISAFSNATISVSLSAIGGRNMHIIFLPLSPVQSIVALRIYEMYYATLAIWD
jgi:hypothetical protein